MNSPMPWRALACTCLTALLAFAAPAAAAPSLPGSGALPSVPGSAALPPDDRAMVGALNSARADNGLPPLQVAPALESSSSSYASVLARESKLQHARLRSGHGFKELGEILGLASGGGGSIHAIVSAWLQSPVHRPILLSHSFRFVGVGVGRGQMGGQLSTFWVVRFGKR